MTLQHNVEYQLNVKTPIRDGVELAADLYLPRADGPVPHGAHAHSV